VTLTDAQLRAAAAKVAGHCLLGVMDREVSYLEDTYGQDGERVRDAVRDLARALERHADAASPRVPPSETEPRRRAAAQAALLLAITVQDADPILWPYLELPQPERDRTHAAVLDLIDRLYAQADHAPRPARSPRRSTHPRAAAPSDTRRSAPP